MDNTYKRLYKCFETVVAKWNGKLCVPLDCSMIISEEFGYECAREFIGELYKIWCETHTDGVYEQHND